MKNDLSEAHITIQKEKENNLHLEKVITQLQSELNTAKRTLKTYRNVFLHMQREANIVGGFSLPNINTSAQINKTSQSSLET